MSCKDEFLRIEKVGKRYGGVQALEDASLSCKKGEIHILIGQNGAGKSTLVKIISGVVQRDSGEIYIDGNKAEINSVEDAEKNKIAAVFQELTVLPELSVAENLFLGKEVTNKLGKINFKEMYAKAEEYLKNLGICYNPRFLVRDLNLCQMQMLEIAKALIKSPEILILDEATSALGADEVQWLFSMMRKMAREENRLILFISHRMEELHQVADRATVFRDAHFVTSFHWGELTDDQIVAEMSGKAKQDLNLKCNTLANNNIALELKAVNKGHVLNNVSFKLRQGEILGIAGLSGHGQVELLHGLFGDGPFDTGTVIANGKKINIRNEREAIKNGIVLVPEDRKRDGLILKRSIGENITMMSLKDIQKWGTIARKKEKESITNSVSNLRIKMGDANQAVENLSGGNQQKVVVAKALLTKANIILLSDPTRGIDVGTKTEIYNLIFDLVKEGVSIVFFSTETSELMLLCNRVLVFYEGGISAELEGDNITEEKIIANSIGIGGRSNE